MDPQPCLARREYSRACRVHLLPITSRHPQCTGELAAVPTSTPPDVRPLRLAHMSYCSTGSLAPAPTSAPPGAHDSSHGQPCSRAHCSTPPGDCPQRRHHTALIPRAVVLPRPPQRLQLSVRSSHITRPLAPRAVMLPRPPQQVQVPARCGFARTSLQFAFCIYKWRQGPAGEQV